MYIIKIIKNFKAIFNDFIHYLEADFRGECEIPKSVFESIARVLLPEITAFFESEEGKKEYEQYKKNTKQSELKSAV